MPSDRPLRTMSLDDLVHKVRSPDASQALLREVADELKPPLDERRPEGLKREVDRHVRESASQQRKMLDPQTPSRPPKPQRSTPSPRPVRLRS